MNKSAKFKSDLLKTNEDIAPQSREIFQTPVWWGHKLANPPPPFPPTIQTSVNFRSFAELYLCSLKTNHFQFWQVY